jgi:hypothetical protein
VETFCFNRSISVLLALIPKHMGHAIRFAGAVQIAQKFSNRIENMVLWRSCESTHAR